MIVGRGLVDQAKMDKCSFVKHIGRSGSITTEQDWAPSSSQAELPLLVSKNFASAKGCYTAASPSIYTNHWLPYCQTIHRVSEPLLNAYTGSAHRTLTVVRDAFCLLIHGAAHNDRRISNEGLKYHVIAVRRLRSDLNLPAPDLVCMMASAQLLLACDPYISTNSARSSRMHAAGVAATLKAAVDNGTTFDTPMGLFILRQSQRLWILHALITGINTLQQPLRIQTVPENYRDALFDAVSDLPGCVHGIRVGASSTRDFHRRLSRTEAALNAWFTSYHSGPRSCPVSVCPKHTEYSRERRPNHDMSQQYLSWLLHALFWLCQLVVVRSRLELECHDKALRVAEGNDHAERLVELVPRVWDIAGGMVGKANAVRGPIHFTVEWYRLTGNHHGLQRCLRLERNYRDQVPYLNWDALLLISFFTVDWPTQ